MSKSRSQNRLKSIHYQTIVGDPQDLDLAFKQVPDLIPIQVSVHELLGLLPVAGK
jgi:hypothetical protein